MIATPDTTPDFQLHRDRFGRLIFTSRDGEKQDGGDPHHGPHTIDIGKTTKGGRYGPLACHSLDLLLAPGMAACSFLTSSGESSGRSILIVSLSIVPLNAKGGW